MDITIHPNKLHGKLRAIPSKSQAHRLLTCAAFSDQETTLHCPETNQDIEATAACLNALGAVIKRTADGYIAEPIRDLPSQAFLDCRESGSTLRFMLPIAGALGIDTTFTMTGRLTQRPLAPLWEEIERMGCALSRPTDNTIRCTGKLIPGNYSIAGNISSQFITGLLFSMALMDGNSTLTITGNLESKPYIEMTQQVLAQFGVASEGYRVSGSRPFRSPGQITVEGDWSNAAFFLAANTLGSHLHIEGLDSKSSQGDRAVAEILERMNQFCTVNAEDIPDLVPILAVVAGTGHGAEFTNIRRLRLKESDRIASVVNMLRSLGAHAEATENTLRILPSKYHGCTIDAAGDHRIAMAAAIAATAATGTVTISGAQCVAKSYPSFWEEYRRLGGNYEQYIR